MLYFRFRLARLLDCFCLCVFASTISSYAWWSSASVLPTASGLDSGSRSANRLNQADRSVDPPPGASETTTQPVTQRLGGKRRSGPVLARVFTCHRGSGRVLGGSRGVFGLLGDTLRTETRLIWSGGTGSITHSY